MRINTEKLVALHAVEAERFVAAHPASIALARRAGASLVRGVPMPWMQRWASPVPPFAATARGAEVIDADNVRYLDLALGDTAAMAGHAPEPVVRAVAEQLAHGATTMLPSTAAIDAAEELTRRFGLPLWQLVLTATDANRFILRLARLATGRPKILVHNWCYHGTVDEAFATIDPAGTNGAAVTRIGNLGPQVDPAHTTRVVEINDLAATEAALATGDVAAILIEPALTNIGIVLPEAGYHAALRALATRYGALLIIDETHTISLGPGGATAAWGLQPDALVIGKAIAGGVPGATYGMTRELAEKISQAIELDEIDTGGIGGTVSGSVLSAVAIRATLGAFGVVTLVRDSSGDDCCRNPLGRRGRRGPRSTERWLERHAARCTRRISLHTRGAAHRWCSGCGGRPRPRALPPPPCAQSRHHPHAIPQHGALLAINARRCRRPTHGSI